IPGLPTPTPNVTTRGENGFVFSNSEILTPTAQSLAPIATPLAEIPQTEPATAPAPSTPPAAPAPNGSVFSNSQTQPGHVPNLPTPTPNITTHNPNGSVSSKTSADKKWLADLVAAFPDILSPNLLVPRKNKGQSNNQPPNGSVFSNPEPASADSDPTVESETVEQAA